MSAGGVNHPAWQAVAAEAERLKGVHLRQLLADDPQRAQRFCRTLGPLLWDFSRQRIDEAALDALVALGEAAQLPRHFERLFRGEPVNVSENRPALHTALRQQDESPVVVDGENVIPAIRREQAKMAELVARLHAGQWRGYSGFPITDVVNLGVGGSDLGPQMAVQALEEFRHPDCKVRLHYVSNLDGRELLALLKDRLKPATTLFVVASKTFTTIDTLTNANTAREWLLRHVDGRFDEKAILRQHFIGISANPAAMSGWGIAPEHQLRFWDWVGGRYSLWSAIGFSIALWLGMDGFNALLAGAAMVDAHVRTAPVADNLPMLLALLEVWNHNFLGLHAKAVLPYDGRLALLPRYLEQLEMESLGKSVTLDGQPLAVHSGPVVWGDTGPNAQHAFYQLLHQGTEAVMCEFIATVKGRSDVPDEEAARARHHQRLNLANCLAQIEALATGADSEDPHRRYPGNRPGSLLLFDALTPHTLGMLIALYEHKVYAQAMLLGINPFDQWGVELGKRIARELLGVLESGGKTPQDAVTAALVEHIRQREAEA